MGTAFSYQGRLDQNGQPTPNGLYGLSFALYDLASAGNFLGTNLLVVPVTNGLFTTSLDFGATAFTGDARWLEVGVNTNTVGAIPRYQILLPRTRIAPNGNDVVGIHRCLALGPDGMVAITGSSQGSFGSDFATVVYQQLPPEISITLIPTGVRLRFPGVASHSYQVLRAPAVTGPWSTSATFTAITNGIIEYIDTHAPPGTAFYRTATAP